MIYHDHEITVKVIDGVLAHEQDWEWFIQHTEDTFDVELNGNSPEETLDSLREVRDVFYYLSKIHEVKEMVDASQIAAQANSYAVSLGFVADNSLNKGNSGYYNPDYRAISSNEVGISAAKDLVSATKNQLNSRFSEDFSSTLIESIFGVVRENCAVEYSHTDDMGDWYYIYVFYG